MEISHKYDRFRSMIKPAMQSKMEEFQVLGYGTITEQELWNFFTEKKWKKPREDAQLHEIVQDVLSLQVGEYMNFATVEAFKQAEFSFDDAEERKKLLR